MTLSYKKVFCCLVSAVFLMTVFFTNSCTYDTLYDDDDIDMPIDTLTLIDTVTGVVCHPDTVYFELEVMPILKSNCGQEDCHSAGEAHDGVKMESYQTVMETGGIKPYMPEETRIFKQMTHTDEEERMPPPPYDRLSERQVQVIEDWINQGANNFRCDSSTVPCDTENVSYENDIYSFVRDACYGCHNQYIREGNLELLDYDDIRSVALNGSLVGTITAEPGYVRMPFGNVTLSVCSIEKVKAWVTAGAPQN